jgi:hypothetical protein
MQMGEGPESVICKVRRPLMPLANHSYTTQRDPHPEEFPLLPALLAPPFAHC